MMPMANVAIIARFRKSVIFRIFVRGENRVVQEEAPCLLPENPHCVEKKGTDKQTLREKKTEKPHTSFFSTAFTHNQMCILTAWLKTSHPMCLCGAHSFHLHVIHDVCLSVRCPSLRVCPSPVSLCCLPLLFPLLPAL